jgi:hypothetical protein
MRPHSIRARLEALQLLRASAVAVLGCTGVAVCFPAACTHIDSK